MEEKIPSYNEIDDAPPAYDMGMDVVVAPSAPTEDFNELPPGYNATIVGGSEGGITIVTNENINGNDIVDRNEVQIWLKQIGDEYYTDYYGLFLKNGFDTMELMKTLNDNDLKDVIGIDKLGHRRKLLMEIEKIGNITIR